MLKSWMQVGIWVSAVVISASPAKAEAQDAGRFVGVVAGKSQYDLSGTGTASIVGVRLGTQIHPYLSLEAGVSHLRYRSQGEEWTRHLFPEIQLQLLRSSGALRPYLGIGAGASQRSYGEVSSFDLTLSTAAGVRVPLGSGMEAQAELRVRAVDPWVGTTADWSVGLAKRW